MIRVGAGICYNFCCFIKWDSLFCQKANQFRNYHGWVRVVNLNCRIVCKVMQITASVLCFRKNQLCTAAYHKILLVHAQKTAFVIRIIRIQK